MSGKGIDLVFARIPLIDFLTVNSMEEEGSILADVLLSFGLDLRNRPYSDAKTEIQIRGAAMRRDRSYGNSPPIFRDRPFSRRPGSAEG